MLDAIIVGQGIAGTVLSYLMMERGSKVMVIDQGHKDASSQVAAGLINPITGRKYVKSWMIDALMPAARQVYQDLSTLLDEAFIDNRTIIRSLHTAEDENQWYGRISEPGYAQYLSDNYEGPDYSEFLHEVFSLGNIHQSMSVKGGRLLSRWREYLEQRESLSSAMFDEDALIVSSDHIQYGESMLARRIIYCGGWRDSLTSMWHHLPYRLAKGEALLVELSDFPESHILKHHKFIVPQSDGVFWVGGTYAWQPQDSTPSADKLREMTEYLDRYVKSEYKIVDHRAAIRPATKYRRPFVGTHPDYQNVHILGGLGTKGFSLAPYWAGQLIDHIYADEMLTNELPTL